MSGTEIRTLPGDPLTTVHRHHHEAAEPDIPTPDHRHQNDDAWSRPMTAEPVPATRAPAAATDGRARRYIPTDIEPRWQRQWEEDGLYVATTDSDRPKYYALVMFPYT